MAISAMKALRRLEALRTTRIPLIGSAVSYTVSGRRLWAARSATTFPPIRTSVR